MIFFFFQAEDGIRDYKVTGVQTCALPISRRMAARTGKASTRARASACRSASSGISSKARTPAGRSSRASRSEERRVGKEYRMWWRPTNERWKRRRKEKRQEKR